MVMAVVSKRRKTIYIAGEKRERTWKMQRGQRNGWRTRTELLSELYTVIQV